MKALVVPATPAPRGGSPHNGGRPTPKVTALLTSLGKSPLTGAAVRKSAHALKAGGADIIAAPSLLTSLGPNTASMLNRGF
ncbi:MAG: hypothetical protein ABWX85_14390 [Arthrobacter sp.]